MFFGTVTNKVMLCSQSFVFPEYEQSETTNPQLSPFPSRFPSKFHYPSKESMNPPWYQLMVERLLEWMQYSDFDFCDFPVCIIYASMAGVPAKQQHEVLKAIEFPFWMGEFVSDIPIIRIVVYDGLITSQPPPDCSAPKGAFDSLFGLCFRTRRLTSPGPIAPVDLRTFFQYDEQLLASPNLCGYIGNADVEAARSVLKSIATIVRPKLDQLIRTHEFEVDSGKHIGARLKGFFTKKAPERITDHLGIPWRKAVHLRLAGLYFCRQEFEQARKNYRAFISSLHEGQFLELKVSAQFLCAVASILLPGGAALFREGIKDVVQTIATAKSIRFLLMVPIVACEFHADAGEYNDATTLCRKAIAKITQLWTGNLEMKVVMLALFHERLAGMTRDPRRSAFATARAAMLYRQGNQPPHALGCLIWLTRVLPRETWVMLYQYAWLEKANVLCLLKQWHRALTDCKELLALKNLHPLLHEPVISRFWSPFNDSSLSKDQLVVTIGSLLEVRSLTITDKTVAEYWGFEAGEFRDVITEFDAWFRQKLKMTKDVSFDAWWDDDETQRSEAQKWSGRSAQGMNCGSRSDCRTDIGFRCISTALFFARSTTAMMILFRLIGSRK
jgi:tetratricopeptide (TPR) repeat protein